MGACMGVQKDACECKGLVGERLTRPGRSKEPLFRRYRAKRGAGVAGSAASCLERQAGGGVALGTRHPPPAAGHCPHVLTTRQTSACSRQFSPD